MPRKLYLGNLPYSTDSAALKAACEPYGEVVDAKVIVDRETGRSKGFGFVTFATDADAALALESLNQSDYGGRTLRVDFAADKPRVTDGGGERRGSGRNDARGR